MQCRVRWQSSFFSRANHNFRFLLTGPLCNRPSALVQVMCSNDRAGIDSGGCICDSLCTVYPHATWPFLVKLLFCAWLFSLFQRMFITGFSEWPHLYLWRFMRRCHHFPWHGIKNHCSHHFAQRNGWPHVLQRTTLAGPYLKTVSYSIVTCKAPWLFWLMRLCH